MEHVSSPYVCCKYRQHIRILNVYIYDAYDVYNNYDNSGYDDIHLLFKKCFVFTFVVPCKSLKR